MSGHERATGSGVGGVGVALVWPEGNRPPDRETERIEVADERIEIAERDAIEQFFGKNVNAGAIPNRHRLEEVPPRDQLLGSVNPAFVESRCPAAERFLNRLRELQGAMVK